MIKIISFTLDICPFVGSFKLMAEACIGKEMAGDKLIGNARTIHLVIGVISLVLDFVSVGIGGSAGRAVFKLFGKGFLRRGATTAGKALARDAALQTGKRAVLQKQAGKRLVKTGAFLNRAERTYLGKKAINYSEKKIRKGVEHTIGNIHGYRLDSKKREEMREKYGGEAKSMKEIEEIKKEEKQEKAMSYFQRRAQKKARLAASEYYDYDFKTRKLKPVEYQET